MSHTIVTFITRVDPRKEDQLKQVLAEIQPNPVSNPHISFGALEQLHFASLVLFPDDEYGTNLVFENNFDGPLDVYLDELVRQAGDGLDRIYRCCLGYPAGGHGERQGLTAYLRRHVVRPNAYHIGNVGRSLERIRREAGLRESLEQFLDDLVRTGQAGPSPGAIRRRIREYVHSDRKWAWAADVRPRQTIRERFLPWARLRGAALAAILLAPVLLPPGLIWLAILRWKEAHDSVWSGLPEHEHVQQIVEREDRSRLVQNHLASLARVKPGPFRRLTLRLVLWVANLVARTSTNGTLSGIPSIHFAHWSQIDNGRRLLFLSNFDGSWENYLDDFIDKASNGLTAIWSNTVEFPRTYFLIWGGSRDGPNFKAISRARQFPTTVWYSAYPDLTVQQIDKNSTIREGLSAPLTEQHEEAWLRNF